MVEGNGPGQALLVFPVTRTGDLSGASSARFTMTYDTATYDVDVGYPFSPTEDTPDHVHLAPGVATAQVRAVVRPDTEVEPDETVTLTLNEPVNAELIDAVATGTVLDDDQAVPPPVRRGVDLALRSGAGQWRGAGLVNGTGAGQTLAKRTPRGRAARFSVRLQNTGSGIDGVALATALSGTPYQVRYLVGSRDVTAQVRSGSWTTGPLAAGAARVITVVVKVPRRVRIGAARRVVLKGTSQQGGQGRRDVVALVVRARR